MDTRSVVRSRRRSTRLTGHSLQDERARSPCKNKKRDSGHVTSGNSSTSASRESSCPRTDSNSKNASLSPNALQRTQNDKPTKEAKEDQDNGVVLPLFPNLHPSQAKAAAAPSARSEPVVATRKKPAVTTSEKAAKDRVSNKWIRTARGSIRLASDSPVETLGSDEDENLDEAYAGQHAPPATSRRRSRRLTSISLDVMDETVEDKPLRSRRLIAIQPEASVPATAGPSEPQESELDLPGLSIEATPEQETSTDQRHDDDLPVEDGKTNDPLDQEPEHPKNIHPIPELVADIERIILSSPLAVRDMAKHAAEHALSPTPAQAFKNRAPASIATRSRTLRSSSRSLDNHTRIEKSLDLERIDSDSSQFDGAFDDSLRGRKKNKAQDHRGTANKPKPRNNRGTKRSAQELSESEGSAPAPATRQRRNPGSDRPTPDVDLSSSNPIEAATSRDAFAVDDPNVEAAVGITEFVRRSGEPPNPVTLAHMISNNRPERANSDSESIRAQNGSLGSSRLQSPESDRPTCADCGREPERYITCARCLVVIYCGKYCQLWDWPVHKARCNAVEEADQAEVEMQERYLGDMWAAALRMLEEENMAGGTVESLLLEEAVRHPPGRPAFMGQGRPHGFSGLIVGSSRSVLQDSESMDETRARSIRVAQAAQRGRE